jgi:hypothetical protein
MSYEFYLNCCEVGIINSEVIKCLGIIGLNSQDLYTMFFRGVITESAYLKMILKRGFFKTIKRVYGSKEV